MVDGPTLISLLPPFSQFRMLGAGARGAVKRGRKSGEGNDLEGRKEEMEER